MKLCLIFPHYPPNHRIGGIEDYSAILVDKFREFGIDTYVIASARYKGDDQKVFKIGNTEWGLNALKETITIIQRENFDVVLMQYTPDAYGYGLSYKLLPLCLRFLKKPPFFITTFHTLVGGKWISKIHAFLLSLFSHKILSTNEELTFLFKKYFWMFEGKLKEIPIGSNIARINITKEAAKEKLSQNYAIDKNAVWLSNFGFTIPNKGIEDLFEAFAVLREKRTPYYLFMISTLREGDETYRAELEKLAGTLKIDPYIKWIHDSSPDDISMILTSSDIYVLPYKDGLCTRRGTLMAGIEHQLPIISTFPRVSQSYFHNEENILLVQPGDFGQLAKAIDRLATDESLKSHLIENIKKLNSRFDWNTIAAEIVRVYGGNSKSVLEHFRFFVKMIIESLEYFAWRIILRKSYVTQKITNMTEISPSKILLIQMNSIGDVLMTTPVLKSLRQKFPNAKIDVLTLPHTGGILDRYSYINRIHSLPAQGWRGKNFFKYYGLLKAIKNENYDIGVDFNGTFESASLSAFLVKGFRVGFNKIMKRGFFQIDSPSFYQLLIPYKEQHIIENNFVLVNALGCSVENRPHEPFPIKEQELKEANTFLSHHGLEHKRYAVIHPGAKWPPKRWPAGYFAELIDLLHKELNLKTILIGGPNDEALLNQIKGLTTSQPIVCYGLNIGVIASILKTASVFIGNDSGISHLASQVYTPTIVLFGPTNPKFCLAPGDHVVSLQCQTHCWPCTLYYRRSYCEMGDNFCLKKLKPANVMERIKTLCA